MMKVPRAGAVKTRLVPPLTHTEAADLSLCFLRDLTANINRVCQAFTSHEQSKNTTDITTNVVTNVMVEGVAVYTPDDARASLAEWLPATFHHLPQRGETLDARLINAAEDLFHQGFSAVCLIGGDSPTLPAAYLTQAVTRLMFSDERRVVIGAAEDGGYYLIGFTETHHHLFSDIEWSTARVLTQTLERAADIALEVELLPAWYDVDDAASLSRLMSELFAARRSESEIIGYEAAHTRRFLTRLARHLRLASL